MIQIFRMNIGTCRVDGHSVTLGYSMFLFSEIRPDTKGVRPEYRNRKNSESLESHPEIQPGRNCGTELLNTLKCGARNFFEKTLVIRLSVQTKLIIHIRQNF